MVSNVNINFETTVSDFYEAAEIPRASRESNVHAQKDDGSFREKKGIATREEERVGNPSCDEARAGRTNCTSQSR